MIYQPSLFAQLNSRYHAFKAGVLKDSHCEKAQFWARHMYIIQRVLTLIRATRKTTLNCMSALSVCHVPKCSLHTITTTTYNIRPLAGYGLPPPRGNFVDHIFLEAQCLAKILQHVSPLTMAALSCNSLLHTLPYKIFDN